MSAGAVDCPPVVLAVWAREGPGPDRIKMEASSEGTEGWTGHQLNTEPPEGLPLSPTVDWVRFRLLPQKILVSPPSKGPS